MNLTKALKNKYVILFLIAFAVRTAYIFFPSFDVYSKTFPVSYYSYEQISDGKTYVNLANGILEYGYPSKNGSLIMYGGYVYPFVVAMFLKFSMNLIPLFLFQAFISSLLCIMSAKVSVSIFKNEMSGLITGILWAFYYPAFFTIPRPLTEMVFTFLFFGGIFYILTVKHKRAEWLIYFISGIIFSIATLTRAVLFYVFIFMLISYAVYFLVGKRKFEYKIVYALLGFMMIQFPWTYLGYVHTDRIVFASSGGGGNLAIGTNIPGKGEYSNKEIENMQNHPKNIVDRLGKENNWTNAQKDSAYTEIAKIQLRENFRDRPLSAVKLMIVQISRFWLNFPFSYKPGIGNIMNTAVTFILLIFMIYGYIKGRRKNKIPADLLLILIILFSIPHSITVSLIRYSFPILPVVYIFSGYGIYTLLSRFGLTKRIGVETETDTDE